MKERNGCESNEHHGVELSIESQGVETLNF
jgi:hypothetical protein